MASNADEIRGYALTHHVKPWQRSGEKRLSIRAGDVVRGMRLQNVTPNVCSALRSRKFQRQAGLVLIHQEGPRASTTTTFHYESDGASPEPAGHSDAGLTALPSSPEPPVSHPRGVSGSGLQDTDLFLVSCVGTKRSSPAPAKDLYISAWFRKARAFVEATGRPWYVLSARYGLVEPDAIIEPYDKTLKTMRAGERQEWAREVLGDLNPLLGGVDSIVFLAGTAYREFLEPDLRSRGVAIQVPMAGMRFGEQLSWLDRQFRP